MITITLLRQQRQPLMVGLKICKFKTIEYWEMDLVKENYSKDKSTKLGKTKSIIEEYQNSWYNNKFKRLKDEFESLKRQETNFMSNKIANHLKIRSDELTKS